jgi:hypothetical protein
VDVEEKTRYFLVNAYGQLLSYMGFFYSPQATSPSLTSTNSNDTYSPKEGR